jgi:hypothetical protein
MPHSLSMLSVAGSIVYGFVLLACLVAAMAARRSRQAPGHVWTWALLGLLFAVLIALRLGGVEEWLRAIMREALRAEGDYGNRRALQAPVAAAILAIAGIGTFAFLYRTTRGLSGRRNIARLVAVVAALAMLFLIALRMASLHMIDALLYGPVKLNWVIDLGASLTVLAAAAYYGWLVRSRR